MPEKDISGSNCDGWYARVAYTDGNRETVPLYQILNFSPKSIDDYNKQEKYVVVSSKWEPDKRPHKYKAYIVRIAETEKLLEESLKIDREKVPTLLPSESDFLSTSDDEDRSLGPRLKPAALEELKRKAAESDFEDFLGMPAVKKGKGRMQSQSRAKEHKNLDKFIQVKQAAPVLASATEANKLLGNHSTKSPSNSKTLTPPSARSSGNHTPKASTSKENRPPGTGFFGVNRRLSTENHSGPSAASPAANTHQSVSLSRSTNPDISNFSIDVIKDLVKGELQKFTESILQAVQRTVRTVVQEEVQTSVRSVQEEVNTAVRIVVKDEVKKAKTSDPN